MGSIAATDVSAVKRSVKTYIGVFVTLLFLTMVTVGISYLHLSIVPAVVLAMLVATVKGGLVALYFMHLNHEHKIIYWTLALAGVFFVFVMAIAFFL